MLSHEKAWFKFLAFVLCIHFCSASGADRHNFDHLGHLLWCFVSLQQKLPTWALAVPCVVFPATPTTASLRSNIIITAQRISPSISRNRGHPHHSQQNSHIFLRPATPLRPHRTPQTVKTERPHKRSQSTDFLVYFFQPAKYWLSYAAIDCLLACPRRCLYTPGATKCGWKGEGTRTPPSRERPTGDVRLLLLILVCAWQVTDSYVGIKALPFPAVQPALLTILSTGRTGDISPNQIVASPTLRRPVPKHLRKAHLLAVACVLLQRPPLQCEFQRHRRTSAVVIITECRCLPPLSNDDDTIPVRRGGRRDRSSNTVWYRDTGTQAECNHLSVVSMRQEASLGS
ncbi:hypothetical protein IWX90DRAFT_137860 [Phyllosticta citrichinensis]|uniref:Secreted protein n=1 Tax=Phyllosticta citrichinensis TaxID=1130410 RepID=A0ABR1XYG0_9PEZI